MTSVRITHIGGPTTLIEVGGWRLLTDPTFDPPGRTYSFGWGTSSRKLTGPAIDAADLAPIDAVLLSHDHHGDNLDDAGRALLPAAGVVVTTAAGAGRLGGNGSGNGNDGGGNGGGNVRALAPWQTFRLDELGQSGRPAIDIIGTPCRHGPPLSRPIVGEVIGFALRWNGQRHGALWISGDTVVYRDVKRLAGRMAVGIALLHLGGVRFPTTGPVRYSMTGRQAVELCRMLRPHTVIPVHYEGWRHFRQTPEAMERDFANAPADIRSRIRRLPIGTPLEVTA